MRKIWHNPTISMDTPTFNQLQWMTEETGMSQSLLVRRLIVEAAERMKKSPISLLFREPDEKSA